MDGRTLKAIMELLLSLFGSNQLERFVRYTYGTDIAYEIAWDNAPIDVAQDVTDLLERHGYVDETFFQKLEEERPNRKSDIQAVRDLWRGGAPPRPDPEPRKLSEDELGRIELEAVLGDEDQTLTVEFLRRGLEASRAVARLRIPPHFGGDPQYDGQGEPIYSKGTGWLVTRDLLVTNHHLVNARPTGFLQPMAEADEQDLLLQARGSLVEFDYFDDEVPPYTRRVCALEAIDRQLDVAVLRLEPPLAGDEARRPLELRKTPMTRPRDTRLSLRANLLQHPDGAPMRVGFRDNYVVEGTQEWISYLADTRKGSSGSPVCDDRWKVAALHRGNRALDPALAPVLHGKRLDSENYGTAMAAIMTWMRTASPRIHDEIRLAQEQLGS